MGLTHKKDIMVHAVQDMGDLDAQLTNAGAKLVVIDFHAVWCGPCKMIAPHLEEMSKTMNDVVFLKVDVDDCEDIAAKYNITAMPTLSSSRTRKRLLILLELIWIS